MVVIFDLDGTLTKKDTYLPFLALCIRELGLRNLSALTLPFYSFLYLTKIISNHALKEHFLQKILSGVSLKQLEPIVDRFVSQLVESGLNESIFFRMNDHIKQGDSVILATASFDLYVLKLADKIRIKNILCTQAEVQNGEITGRILGNNCHGIEKVKRIEKKSSQFDWKTAIAYSDHHSDNPLFKKVGKSFLVKPNFITRFKLRKYNFPIIN